MAIHYYKVTSTELKFTRTHLSLSAQRMCSKHFPVMHRGWSQAKTTLNSLHQVGDKPLLVALVHMMTMNDTSGHI